jgi:hypothetical protein
MGGPALALGAFMKRLIGFAALLCLLASMVGCGGVSSTGTLAYISNSTGTGFTVYTVNTDGTLTRASISPQSVPAAGVKQLLFTANGKWAYFLDEGGQNIWGYERNGDGSLGNQIGSYPVDGASAIALSPNSNFLYVALPNVPYGTQKGELQVYSIDSSAGILYYQAGSLVQTVPIEQLIMASGGTVLYGLSKEKQAVVSFTITPTNGNAVQSATASVGPYPTWMILSTNGSYMYVLDQFATAPLPTPATIANGTVLPSTCPSGGFDANGNPIYPPAGYCSPNIYGFTTSSNGTLTSMAGSPFHENYDLLSNNFPSGPLGGATSPDSRYLYVINQNSHNISVFKIGTGTVGSTAGEPVEILGSVTTVNGVQTSTASPFDCGVSSGCVAPSFAAVSGGDNGLYAVDTTANKIFQFRVDLNTGKLRPQSPAYVAGEGAPVWITIR